MSVTLFGIGLAAVLACASFVAYWYGWRFAKMMFYSATVNALGRPSCTRLVYRRWCQPL